MAKSWIDDAWLRDAVDRDGNRIPPTAAMRRAAGADPEKAKKTIPPEHRTARYGKGSRWVVYWNAPDGRRRKAFRSRADAEAFRAGMEDDLRSGRYIDPRGGERTVADAYREWIGTLVNIKVTANAIIHRNTGLAVPVLVKAFTTRVEVVSLGGLNGLSSDDLLNGVSLPVNPPCSTGSSPKGSRTAREAGLPGSWNAMRGPVSPRPSARRPTACASSCRG